MNIFNYFSKPKKILFIDGDQGFSTFMKNTHANHFTDTETYFVTSSTIPKKVRNITGINIIQLTGFSGRKEVTDKYIAMAIQKAIVANYSEISVISADYDFVDIFNLAVILNNNTTVFNMIPVKAKGRLKSITSTKDVKIVRF